MVHIPLGNYLGIPNTYLVFTKTGGMNFDEKSLLQFSSQVKIAGSQNENGWDGSSECLPNSTSII